MTLAGDGIERLPDSRQQPLILAVVQASIEQLDANDTVTQQILDAFDLTSSATRSFLLDDIGDLIGQPRRAGENDDDYKISILGRIIVRNSSGTLQDVKAVARYLSAVYGDGRYSVRRTDPKTLKVGIGNLPTTGDAPIIAAQLLTDAIGEVDRMTLFSVQVGAFTWGVEGLGWGQSVWAAIIPLP